MRFYLRTGRNSGISIGIFGALILTILAVTYWAYALALAAMVVVLVAVYRGLRWLWRQYAGRRAP